MANTDPLELARFRRWLDQVDPSEFADDAEPWTEEEHEAMHRLMEICHLLMGHLGWEQFEVMGFLEGGVNVYVEDGP